MGYRLDKEGLGIAIIMNAHLTNRPHLLRTLIQWLYLGFCVLVGVRFFLFCKWLAVGGAFHERPPAVEAFLPISALVGLYHLILTGTWDPVHPAGLFIFIAIVCSALLFRKAFCGWICPVGTISSLLQSIGQRLNVALIFSRWLALPLSSIKYLLLGFFIYFIFFNMSPYQVESFLTSPYNIVADIKMLNFFIHPTTTTLAAIVCLAVLSVFIGNFWCKYLCPYGALLGLLGCASPFQVKRREKACLDCKKCEKACPMSIEITRKTVIRNPDCIGCLKCLNECNVKGALFLHGPLGKNVWPYILPVGTISILLLGWLTARLTGHWISSVPIGVIKQIYSALF